MIENLTASHLGDPDFLDLLCHQVVIQEVLVHNLLSWLAVVRDIVSQAEEGDKSHPALRTRVHIRVEEKVLQPLPELLLVAVILLFLLALLLRLFLLVGVILVLLLVLFFLARSLWLFGVLVILLLSVLEELLEALGRFFVFTSEDIGYPENSLPAL